jgi:hypothetical protein
MYVIEILEKTPWYQVLVVLLKIVNLKCVEIVVKGAQKPPKPIVLYYSFVVKLTKRRG